MEVKNGKYTFFITNNIETWNGVITGINYKIKSLKTVFKIEGELFNQFKKENQDNGINLYRLTMKLNRKIKKNNEIGVFYRIQKDIDRIEPVNRKIIGLKYSHKFDLTN